MTRRTQGVTAAVLAAFCCGSQIASAALDFGDAAEPGYATLLASDGARHTIDNSTLFLGLIVDAELDGQPSAGADGDDLTGADDEDGVVFTSTISPGRVATLELTVSATGLLNAWMDFNLDGSWAGIGEQIFADLALSGGTSSLGFSVPAAAISGVSYARFRLDSGGGLSFTGAADDGEVEDYRVVIEASRAPEPGILILIGIGLVGLVVFTRKLGRGKRRNDD